MKYNLNSVGDGIIVLALGILFLSFSIVAYNNYLQTTGSSTTQSQNSAIEVSGLLIFSVLFILAGLFKIVQGIKAPEQTTTLKTAAIAAIAAYLMGFGGVGAFYLLFFRLY